MSHTNTLLNAVIALLEDRPKDAREMLRAPGVQIEQGEVLSRLLSAIRKREQIAQVRVLKQVLTESLKIDYTSIGGDHGDQDPHDLVLLGVAELEKIIDEYIISLDTPILA